jgi:activating signal cointegrator complex subunit 2
MATKTAVMLPPMAQFPEAVWRSHLIPEEWTACLDAWISLAEAHLSLSASEFLRRSATDVSVPVFLLSYISEMAKSPDFDGLGDSLKSKRLRRDCFFLTCRLLENNPPPEALSQWEFLAHFAKSYGKSLSSAPIERLWLKSPKVLESSLAALKNLLIRQLEAGLKGDPRALEESLKRLNHMIYASPETATFLTTGSDFLDGLVSCYKLMNPPLRKAIISTTYLCLVGLTESAKPNFSFLADQLYSLKAAADTHKAGPTNINDSLVAELVTVTPILKQIQQRVESSGVASDRAKSVITSLEGFRKAGGGRPKTLLKRKVNKGKGVDHGTETNKIYGQGGNGEVHIHQMSLISQVQDLFPDLGSGFVMKLLNQYDEDVEEVISHLLEGSLPAHLESADRTEQL